jgi:hypothetical protein
MKKSRLPLLLAALLVADIGWLSAQVSAAGVVASVLPGALGGGGGGGSAGGRSAGVGYGGGIAGYFSGSFQRPGTFRRPSPPARDNSTSAAGDSSRSGSAAPAASNAGYSDPQVAFLESAAVRPFGIRRDDGSLDLISSYTDEAGRPCRKYRETVTIDGEKVEATGRVCRFADGSWALVD